MIKSINLKKAISLYNNIKSMETRTEILVSHEVKKEVKERITNELNEARAAYNAATAPINDCIKSVEGRAKERTLSADELIESVIKYVNYLNIPQTKMDGIKITLDYNSQDKPRAYKYKMMNTIAVVVHSGGSWKLTSVERAENRKYMYSVFIPESARNAIIENNYNNIDRWNLR